MHDCVVKLLKNHDEESLECLCRLLTTIGKDLDFEKAKVGQGQEQEMRLYGQGWKNGCGVFLFEGLFFLWAFFVRHEEIICSSVHVSSPPGLAAASCPWLIDSVPFAKLISSCNLFPSISSKFTFLKCSVCAVGS